eukprot:COSAG01_NODE_3578_length_5914_cov_2.371625_4_plen_225_part_00
MMRHNASALHTLLLRTCAKMALPAVLKSNALELWAQPAARTTLAAFEVACPPSAAGWGLPLHSTCGPCACRCPAAPPTDSGACARQDEEAVAALLEVASRSGATCVGQARTCREVGAPWHHGTMAPWHHGTMAPTTMAPWHHGTMAPTTMHHGTTAPWHPCDGTQHHGHGGGGLQADTAMARSVVGRAQLVADPGVVAGGGGGGGGSPVWPSAMCVAVCRCCAR